jgi:hypothetical protein
MPIAAVKFVYPRGPGQPGGGGIALAELENTVGHKNHVDGAVSISGVAAMPNPGAAIRVLGRTSGAVQGTVLEKLAVSAKQASPAFLADGLVGRVCEPCG